MSIESSATLLEKFKNSNTGRFSLIIILRSSTLDYIILNHLLTFFDDLVRNKTEENERIFNKKVFGVVSEQLHFHFKDLGLLHEEGIISDKIFNDMLNELARKYPTFIDLTKLNIRNPKKALKYNESFLNKKMFKRISSNRTAKNFSKLCLHYAMFSKVEHYGILSRELVEDKKLMPIILETIHHLVHGHYLCQEFLSLEHMNELKENAKKVDKLGYQLNDLLGR